MLFVNVRVQNLAGIWHHTCICIMIYLKNKSDDLTRAFNIPTCNLHRSRYGNFISVKL